MRALDEIAVGVGRQQWDVVKVLVGEIDAEKVVRLRLHHLPGRHAADFRIGVGAGAAEAAIGTQVLVGDQLAGCSRRTTQQLIRTQEYLM